jgi:hypothetical protein
MVWQTQGSVTEKDVSLNCFSQRSTCLLSMKNFRQAGIQFIIDNIYF